MPLFSLLFFILCLGNSGTPLTLNFIGEFLSLYGAFERLPVLGALACSSIVFSAAYTIFMYNRIIFGGALSAYFKVNIPDLNKTEFVILISLVVPTVLFGIYPDPILSGLHYSVSTLIYAASNEVGDISMAFIPLLSFVPKRFYSAKYSKPLSPEIIDPYTATGLIDAEGTFMVRLFKNPLLTNGYRVNLEFSIGLHKKDLALLESLKTFFGSWKYT